MDDPTTYLQTATLGAALLVAPLLLVMLFGHSSDCAQYAHLPVARLAVMFDMSEDEALTWLAGCTGRDPAILASGVNMSDKETIFSEKR